jgi:hypothetical protein
MTADTARDLLALLNMVRFFFVDSAGARSTAMPCAGGIYGNIINWSKNQVLEVLASED